MEQNLLLKLEYDIVKTNLELRLLNQDLRLQFPNAPFQRATSTLDQTTKMFGTKTLLYIAKLQITCHGTLMFYFHIWN